ncbi:MAG: DUF2723 domain-containing protein [Gemmatimonadetes bacterium]|nr:DUF2723 domain-containing protein [Gemmatimonadota bacterium]
MTTSYRPAYGAAAATSAAVLALYLLTLSPTTAFWDTSEYIATAQILGIPHPPGNPLFVLLAHVWGTLLGVTGLEPAVRINLFAACTSALASFFWFLVAHRILSRLEAPRWFAVVGAVSATLIGATAFTVWNQSNVNEKVYTVSVTIIALVTWFALRWRDLREEPAGLRYLLGAFYALAIGSTNHLMSVLPLPALALFLLRVEPRTLLSRALWVRAPVLLVLGLSVNFFLPIRAARDPVINEGQPACERLVDAAVSIYTLGAKGCRALSANLRREQYQKPPLTARQSPFVDQLRMFFQYFDWQWARGVAPEPTYGNMRLLYTALFLLLGLYGLRIAWGADREAGLYLVALTLTLSLGLVFYLNFKYGFSLAPHIQDLGRHEVRERDYFFIASFALWGMLAGVGLTGIGRLIARGLRTARPFVLVSPVLIVAVIPLITNWRWAARNGDYAARDWAYDLLMSVEPYGVLFTNGDNDTFPLWYVQEVEGVRRDVTVIVGQYLATSWYPRQLQRLTKPEQQRPFSPVATPPFYADVPAPARSILSLAPEELDRITGWDGRAPLRVRLGTLEVEYAQGMQLSRSHVLALAVIRDSVEERPIYFANTTGLGSELGLAEHGVRQGLVTRLWPGELSAVPSLAQLPREVGGGWIDVDRTVALVDSVYTYRGLRDRDIWPDLSTANIPWQFYVTHLQLADVFLRYGNPEVGNRFLADANGFLELTRGGSVVAPPRSDTAP